MKLSTRSRYGIHAMYDLARRGPGEPQSIKAIAERQRIPEAYLEQLIGPLRKSGLVKSVRGAQGGYLLAQPPEEITVGQVIRALEGDLNLVDCLAEEDACGKACSCATRIVWRKVNDGLNQIVDGITLQDIIDDYERTCSGKDTDTP
ncbi:MAG: Rrf2 family transcriptional regulator [Clostridia bacterium]|nr:Rrf2 family transcriptional regulator [Clostridia bacterium]